MYCVYVSHRIKGVSFEQRDSGIIVQHAMIVFYHHREQTIRVGAMSTVFQIGMSVKVFQSIQNAFRQIFKWEYGRDVVATNKMSGCQSGDVGRVEESRYFRINVWQSWWRWSIIVQLCMIQDIHDSVWANDAHFREIPIEWQMLRRKISAVSHETSPRSPLDIGSDQIHPFICTPVAPQKRGVLHPTTTLHTTGQLAVSPPHLGLLLQEDLSSSRTQTQRQNSTKSVRSQGRGPINEIYH